MVSRLTPGQFVESVAASYGSVRNTLVHVLSAEWGGEARTLAPPGGDDRHRSFGETLGGLSDDVKCKRALVAIKRIAGFCSCHFK